MCHLNSGGAGSEILVRLRGGYFLGLIFTDIDLSKIDYRLIARYNLLYDLYKGKKSVEMEYLYVGT